MHLFHSFHLCSLFDEIANQLLIRSKAAVFSIAPYTKTKAIPTLCLTIAELAFTRTTATPGPTCCCVRKSRQSKVIDGQKSQNHHQGYRKPDAFNFHG